MAKCCATRFDVRRRSPGYGSAALVNKSCPDHRAIRATTKGPQHHETAQARHPCPGHRGRGRPRRMLQRRRHPVGGRPRREADQARRHPGRPEERRRLQPARRRCGPLPPEEGRGRGPDQGVGHHRDRRRGGLPPVRVAGLRPDPGLGSRLLQLDLQGRAGAARVPLHRHRIRRHPQEGHRERRDLELRQRPGRIPLGLRRRQERAEPDRRRRRRARPVQRGVVQGAHLGSQGGQPQRGRAQVDLHRATGKTPTSPTRRPKRRSRRARS